MSNKRIKNKERRKSKPKGKKSEYKIIKIIKITGVHNQKENDMDPYIKYLNNLKEI